MSFSAGAIAPWPLVPDWSEPVTESLAWLTDVMRASRSASSQHRALRTAPRRSLTWSALAAEQDRRLVDLLLAERSAQAWLVPVWPDVQQLATAAAAAASSLACNTAGRDFVAGGKALLLGSSRAWEVVAVQSVAADQLLLAQPTSLPWPAGTRLLPVRVGRMAQVLEQAALSPELGRRQVQAAMDEVCDWPAAMPTSATYRSWPVLEWRPDESEPPSSADLRSLGLVDNQTAPAAVLDLLDVALRSQRARWLLGSRAELSAWRSMLYALAGRANPVWVPSWTEDLKLVQAITAVATTITVEWSGYELFGLGKPSSRDIRIELFNGTAFCRRVSAATATANTETLTINAALGQAVAPADVRAISFLRLCTLASDEVQLEHLVVDGPARCELAFAGVSE